MYLKQKNQLLVFNKTLQNKLSFKILVNIKLKFKLTKFGKRLSTHLYYLYMKMLEKQFDNCFILLKVAL